MGSSCSILNDTEFDVWVCHGVNWTVLTATVGSVAALLTAGVGALALGATAGVGGALAGGGALIMAEEGIIMGTATTTLAGLTAAQWTAVGIVTALSSSALATILNISREEAEKIKKQVEDFQRSSERIRPGDKYTVKGTLSLTMKYYVMNEKVQFDDRACFTGPTANSENVYPISEYFKKLDAVRKKPEDTYKIYSCKTNDKNILLKRNMTALVSLY